MKKRLLSLALLLISLLLLASCAEERRPPEPEAAPTHVHEFGKWKYFVRPTCTTYGIKHRECECGEVEVEHVSAFGHKKGKEIIEEPTCVDAGFREVYCANCEIQLLYEVLDAFGHDYEVVVTPETLDTIGYTTYTCKTCAYTYDDHLVAAWGPVHFRYQVTGKGKCKLLGFYGENDDTAGLLPDGADVTELLVPSVIEVIDGNSTVEYIVESIGPYAFDNCDMLELIVIPDTVIAIDEYAFAGCDALTELRLGSSVLSIGASAFEGCVNLSELTIPETVTAIGASAFKSCVSLTEVDISEGVTSISAELFAGCTSLKKVSLGKDVTSVGNRAFDKCHALEAISELKNVKTIGKYAFAGCLSLKEISLGSDIVSVNLGAFSGTSALSKVSVPVVKDWLEISFADSTANPIHGAAKLYAGGSAVTSLTVSAGINSIGDYQFYGYDYLTSVKLGNSITYLGDNAFADCVALETVSVTSNLEYIGASTFSGCVLLTSVSLPDSIKSVGKYAFAGCSSLASIKLPSNLNVIGEYAFSNCAKLASVNLDMVDNILGFAFYNCSNLKSVSFSDKLTYIGESAFENCGISGALLLPEKLAELGDRAFADCGDISDVTVPESLVKIGESAFKGCEGIVCVNTTDLKVWCAIDFGNAYSNPMIYADKFYIGGEQLTSLVLDTAIESISDYSFSGRAGIEEVYYAGSAAQFRTYIGDCNAFLHSELVDEKLYCYSATKPNVAGRFWHYNSSGEICKW